MLLQKLWQAANRNFRYPQRLPSITSIKKAHSFESGKDKNDAKTSITMAQVKAEIHKRLGLEPGYKPIPKKRDHLLQYLPKPEDLPKRSMQDSYTTAIIPLSTDKNLQELYVSYVGQVRIGRLMEDMDLFAVWICHQHVLVPKLPENVHLPYTFVTILVDKITYGNLNKTQSTSDIRLSGHVSWVGRSSMEVVAWLEQKTDTGLNRVTRALFLMAARNATNTGAAPVNQIEPANAEEKKILSGGVNRKKRRELIQANNFSQMKPTEDEATLMHNIHHRTTDVNLIRLNKRILPEKCRWMTDWITVTTMLVFPENRNAHYTIFGGFIMRQALENGWICCSMYINQRPKCRVCSDISFKKPVSVSSFIKLSSYVVYTQDNFLQIMTVVDILDARAGTQVTSNIFFFTYESQNKLPEILPRTYQETIWYLQGKRKFKYALEEEGEQKSEGKEECKE